ncbi:Tfp pilus assembly protein FimT/FimU [Yersinia ruckeri]|uniref:General secretory pathway proteins G and H n=2 Tax=Yersinia ruckeri TaxID=29486 RepID=A0A380QS41_YERRU|nr:type II secretion system protein [Yersinia ruckeri]AUQ42103.1 type II secretion system protein [Yersinia ruckeri]EKN4199317.1 type II secretion system protein [Yersinia ruckeri]EKN4205776.1 type II secretion system protein [Yersinia ruckeri]EKN4692051.1 type II secretion system protein [Yersinia ruckeri]KGA50593.1 hypothetical protein DJ39_2963 [Yersinia ruckeri ATCC 29473]
MSVNFTHSHGFTLLEVILIVLVLSYLSSLAMINIPHASQGALKDAEKLFYSLKKMKDKLYYSHDVYGISIKDDEWMILRLCLIECVSSEVVKESNIWKGKYWVQEYNGINKLAGKLKYSNFKVEKKYWDNINIDSVTREEEILSFIFFPDDNIGLLSIIIFDEHSSFRVNYFGDDIYLIKTSDGFSDDIKEE